MRNGETTTTTYACEKVKKKCMHESPLVFLQHDSFAVKWKCMGYPINFYECEGKGCIFTLECL